VKKITIIIILISCNNFNKDIKHETNKSLSTIDSNKKEKKLSIGTDTFFSIKDTLRDLHLIRFFFDQIFSVSKGKKILIQDVKTFFPSNEEEISFIENHVISEVKKERMTDSLYRQVEYYSKFFPALATIVGRHLPDSKQIAINFCGFDIIDNPVGNQYDTSYVIYRASFGSGNINLTFLIPFIRDKDYGIANIFDDYKESLIDKTTGSKN
jgi:hypothetical protein